MSLLQKRKKQQQQQGKTLKKPVGVPFLCPTGPVKIEEDRKREGGEI